MGDVRALQERLAAAGYDPGEIDGDRGPHTYAALCSYVAGREIGTVGLGLGRGLEAYCAGFPDLQLAHFIGQACEETEAFRYFTELGGAAYCAKYDGRQDLGNTEPGDGYLFRGRGIFELTGRANYAQMSKLIGIDLVAHPDLAAGSDLAVRIAAIYWRKHNIGPLADADDCAAVTRKINGGENGLDARQNYTKRAKTALGLP